MPVLPSTREAEAGESLEPQRAEVAMSRDRTTALQLGGQSGILSQKTEKRISLVSKEEYEFHKGKVHLV